MSDLQQVKDSAVELAHKKTRGWHRIMDSYVGVLPVPVWLSLIAIIAALTAINGITQELAIVIALSATFAFTLGHLGNNLPLLKNIGGGAILVTFLPSLFAYLGWFPHEITAALGDFFNTSKILNVFIAAVVVGSILSMDRTLLIKGFVKVFVPLTAGTLCAVTAGMTAGYLTGLGLYKSLFFIVVPIMAGGVGEGAIPLTMGYAQILGINQGELLAQVMPSILVGYLTAVILAGLLANLGKCKPHLTGNGVLQRGATDEDDNSENRQVITGTSAFAAAAMTALMLYLTGMLMHELLHWPAPVVMLFLALGMKLGYLISPRLQAGSGIVYRFALTAMAFPILFTFSLTVTPWQSLMAGFAPAHLITIVSTVTAMVLGGFFSARFVNLYPVEAGIIASTHSGMGGAGDIAILTTSHRLSLMPFAQIATRTGGGLNVAFALIAMKFIVG